MEESNKFRYSKAVYALTGSYETAIEAASIGRRLGVTTGELLCAIGYALSHPNEHISVGGFVSDFNLHGEQYKHYLFHQIRDLLYDLGLKYIDVKLSSGKLTVHYDCFGYVKKTVKIEYEAQS